MDQVTVKLSCDGSVTCPPPAVPHLRSLHVVCSYYNACELLSNIAPSTVTRLELLKVEFELPPRPTARPVRPPPLQAAPLGRALAGWGGSLRELDLTNTLCLGNEGLRLLLDTACLAQLRVLRLTSCGLIDGTSSESAGALLHAAASDGRLPRLEEVWLNDGPNHLEDESVLHLMKLPHLRRMVLAGSVSAGCLPYIAEASHTHSFEHIDLCSMEEWDDWDSPAALSAGSWPCLRELRLACVGIQSLEAFAAVAWRFPALEALDLSANDALTLGEVLRLKGRFPRLKQLLLVVVADDRVQQQLASAFPTVNTNFPFETSCLSA